MENIPSWQANSCLAIQEIHRVLWKPKFQYRVLDKPPQVYALSQMNPLHVPYILFL